MIFDDGSTIDENTGIATAAPMGMLPGDSYDYAQMQPFTTGATNQTPWWQSVIAYGMTRAIDNRYAPINVGGNQATGSFAGQNGRSYYQAPNGMGYGAVPQGFGGINPLLLLAGAGLLLFALKD